MTAFDGIIDGEVSDVYISGAAFYLGKNGRLDAYKESLEGRHYMEQDFHIKAIRGKSFELSDPERLRMVLFEPTPLNRVHFIVANAYALSQKAAHDMMSEFRDTTGLTEMDVPEDVMGFYKAFGAKRRQA